MGKQKATIHESLLPLATKISTLKLDPQNARTHSADNIAAIAASIERFGFRDVCVAHRDTRIVLSGNGRITAAMALGMTEVPTIFVDDDEAEAMAFAIGDNRSAELADWDLEALTRVTDQLRAHNLDLEKIGFNDEDLDQLRTVQTFDLTTTPYAGMDLTSFSNRKPPAALHLSGDQWAIIGPAIARVRETSDTELTDGDAIARIMQHHLDHGTT